MGDMVPLPRVHSVLLAQHLPASRRSQMAIRLWMLTEANSVLLGFHTDRLTRAVSSSIAAIPKLKFSL